MGNLKKHKFNDNVPRQQRSRPTGMEYSGTARPTETATRFSKAIKGLNTDQYGGDGSGEFIRDVKGKK